MKGNGCLQQIVAFLNAQSQRFPDGTACDHETHVEIRSVQGPKFEPETSRVRSRNAYHSKLDVSDHQRVASKNVFP
jgi:hypothetical protein